jgi:hypothetical protein
MISEGPETLPEGAPWTRAFWLGGGNVDVKLSKNFFTFQFSDFQNNLTRQKMGFLDP